jgi:glycosyltransferase involved in cell wall biosynthesis
MKLQSIAIVHGDLSSFGGAERIIYLMAQFYVSKGYQVDIITYSVSKHILFQFRQIGCKIITLDVPIININDTKQLSLKFLGWRLRSLVLNYDVINVHNFPATLWLGFAGKFGVLKLPPIIWSCHEPPRYLYDNYKKGHDLKRDFLVKQDNSSVKLFSSIICNSHFTAKAVKTYYGISAKVKHFGVLLEKNIVLNLKKEICFGTVSRLEKIKNIDFIIKALAIFKKENPSIKFSYEIVGVGAEKEYLQKLVYTLGLVSEISFLGFVSHDQLKDCYNRWQFVVFCPFDEPLGLIPLEAASYFIPTVGSKEGGVLETIIHDKTGLLVDPKNSKDLIKTFSRLLGDIDYCKYLGKNAHEFVKENFDFNLTAKFFEAEFINAICK